VTRGRPRTSLTARPYLTTLPRRANGGALLFGRGGVGGKLRSALRDSLTRFLPFGVLCGLEMPVARLGASESRPRDMEEPRRAACAHA
jgi:hypothetical protein